MQEAGINRRAAQTLGVLERLMGLCEEQGVSDLFFLGDFFDTVKPTPQLVAAAMLALTRLHDVYHPRFHFVPGNHERESEANGDHALGPFARSIATTVVEHCSVLNLHESKTDVLLVAYENARPAPVVLKEALEKASGNAGWCKGYQRILGMHFGVRDEKTPPWLQGASDAIDVPELLGLMHKHRIEMAFNGHWHFHDEWKGETGGYMRQLGALVPSGFKDLGGDYGHVAIVLCEPGELVLGMRQQLDGPRFESLRAADLPTFAKQGIAPAAELYLSVTAGRAEKQGAQEALRALKLAGHICDGKVEPDHAASKLAARKAAGAAKSAQTLDEATAAFIAKMELDEGVGREEVLAAVQSYTKGA